MFSFKFNSLNIDALGPPRNNKMFLTTQKLLFFNKSKDLFNSLSAAGQLCDLDVWVALTVFDSFDIVYH